ncbi:MAG: enoyl-CoA hydratase-related protein [Planctomycetaceae bacterium]
MRQGLIPGLTATLPRVVTPDVAIHLGADQPRGAVVFSTPSMINLMEYAARELLKPFLEPGEESVGVTVQVEHLAATPLGARVEAEARVTAVNGKLVDFEVIARDEIDVIGRGTHRRAVIGVEKFAARLNEKVAKLPETAMVPIDVTPNSGELPELETLLVSVEGAVATIALNRPKKLNAVNVQMTSDWEVVNSWLAGHPGIRVVIVTGAGTAFCAGDDVPEVGTLTLDAARELSHRQARLYLAWERLPQVFIAALQGPALGGGCVAAYSCDFRIAAHGANLGMPEIKLGWPPGYGIAQLTALVGKARALELCLTGKQITASQGLAYGLVHEVVPANRVLPVAKELAVQLLAMPAEALRETKRLVHADEGVTPKQTYLADTAGYIRCLELPDAKEGIAAFREKRPAKFGK